MFLSLRQSIASADMDQAQLEAFLTAQTRKQGGSGVTPEQAAALARFWKAHRTRVRENLLAQSRWEPGLRGLKWRVDLHTSASRGQVSNSPVALVELELGCAGEVRTEQDKRGFSSLKYKGGCSYEAQKRFLLSHCSVHVLVSCMSLLVEIRDVCAPERFDDDSFTQSRGNCRYLDWIQRV